MSQQANITVFDGATTPVSHTFQPKDNKVLKDGTRLSAWIEVNAALPEAAKATFVLRQRNLPGGVVETRAELSVPVMEAVAGQNAQGYTAAPKVAYTDRDVYTKYVHPRSTVNSRRLATQMLRNLLNNVATSVTPVSTGVIDEAAVQLTLPT